MNILVLDGQFYPLFERKENNEIRNQRTVRTVHPWEIDQAYAG